MLAVICITAVAFLFLIRIRDDMSLIQSRLVGTGLGMFVNVPLLNYKTVISPYDIGSVGAIIG